VTVPFSREIQRLLFGVLSAFAIIAAAATYWAISGADTILKREDNPRLVEAEARIIRGNVLDRNGTVLAESVVGDGGVVERHYPFRETNGALGYFSLRYGVAGAEAAYDTQLRGDDLHPDLSEYLAASLLHHPQQGSDIRLTLDLAIQQQVAQAMEGHTGAAIVLSVPDGEVLAMVSLPTYDPNSLDSNWEQLAQAPGNPFFNRVLQGRYQPGGTMQTILMATALVMQQPLDTPLQLASASVRVDDTTLTCAVRLPLLALDLREAYAFACPSPFATLGESIGTDGLQAALEAFLFDRSLVLPGFVVEPEGVPSAPPASSTVTPENLVESALGQGPQTINPLTMAVLASAIVNDGNAAQPLTLLAIRRPDSEEWSELGDVLPSLPVTTTNNARQLQDLMRFAVATGAAQNAGRPNVDIGGHSALAYAGNATQAWFVGFATLGGRRGISVAVVLEDTDDAGLAADIGGTALAVAHSALQNQS
jgi:cell division protein FtsI/penicillin-binding protein 2